MGCREGEPGNYPLLSFPAWRSPDCVPAFSLSTFLFIVLLMSVAAGDGEKGERSLEANEEEKARTFRGASGFLVGWGGRRGEQWEIALWFGYFSLSASSGRGLMRRESLLDFGSLCDVVVDSPKIMSWNRNADGYEVKTPRRRFLLFRVAKGR